MSLPMRGSFPILIPAQYHAAWLAQSPFSLRETTVEVKSVLKPVGDLSLYNGPVEQTSSLGITLREPQSSQGEFPQKATIPLSRLLREPYEHIRLVETSPDFDEDFLMGTSEWHPIDRSRYATRHVLRALRSVTRSFEIAFDPFYCANFQGDDLHNLLAQEDVHLVHRLLGETIPKAIDEWAKTVRRLGGKKASANASEGKTCRALETAFRLWENFVSFRINASKRGLTHFFRNISGNQRTLMDALEYGITTFFEDPEDVPSLPTSKVVRKEKIIQNDTFRDWPDFFVEDWE